MNSTALRNKSGVCSHGLNRTSRFPQTMSPGLLLAPSTFWAASRLDKLEALGLIVADGDRYSLQDPEQMSASTRALHDQLAADNGLNL
jgi:hypothetical protein